MMFGATVTLRRELPPDCEMAAFEVPNTLVDPPVLFIVIELLVPVMAQETPPTDVI